MKSDPQLYGVFWALMTTILIDHKYFGSAAFTGIFSLYWFMLAVKRER